MAMLTKYCILFSFTLIVVIGLLGLASGSRGEMRKKNGNKVLIGRKKVMENTSPFTFTKKYKYQGCGKLKCGSNVPLNFGVDCNEIPDCGPCTDELNGHCSFLETCDTITCIKAQDEKDEQCFAAKNKGCGRCDAPNDGDEGKCLYSTDPQTQTQTQTQPEQGSSYSTDSQTQTQPELPALEIDYKEVCKGMLCFIEETEEEEVCYAYKDNGNGCGRCVADKDGEIMGSCSYPVPVPVQDPDPEDA